MMVGKVIITEKLSLRLGGGNAAGTTAGTARATVAAATVATTAGTATCTSQQQRNHTLF